MNLATLIRTRSIRGASKQEISVLTDATHRIAALTAQVEELLEERDAHTCPRCAHLTRLADQASDPDSTKKETRAALDQLVRDAKGK